MARSPLLDIYDPYGTMGAERVEDLLPEEEKTSMLRDLANRGASGLSTVAWLLDTPGAIVRGLLAGDPLSGFGSSDRRVTGRDLLRQYGLAGSEDNWGNFSGGMVAEMALDPLTYASLGLSAILGRGSKTAAAKVAQAAGIMPDDLALAASREGYGGVAQMLRQATPEDLFRMSGSPNQSRSAFEEFARSSGYDPAELLTQPLARSHRIGLPWQDGTAVDMFGQGFGDWAARRSDATRAALFNSAATGPAMRTLQAMFDSRVMGFDDDHTMLGRSITSRTREGERASRRFMAQAMVELARDLGDDLPRKPGFIADARNFLEGQYGQIDPENMAIFQTPQGDLAFKRFRWRLQQQREMMEAVGLDFKVSEPVNDILYAPRQAVYVDNPTYDPRYAQRPAQPARGSAVGDVGQGKWGKREDYTRSIPVWLRNKMTQDAEFQAALRDAPLSGPDNLKQIIDEWVTVNAVNRDGTPWIDRGIFDWIGDELAAVDPFDPMYEKAAEAVAARKAKAYQELADAMRRTPNEFAQRGLPKYGNVFSDLAAYDLDMSRRIATADEILRWLADPRNRVNQAAELVPGSTTYSAAQVGDVLGFDNSATRLLGGGESTKFVDVLAERMGLHPTELREISFPKELVDSFSQKIVSARAPRGTNRLFSFTDWFTDLFKTLALASISRQVRDKYSGSFASATQGAYNFTDEWVAGAVAGGDYTNLPARLKGTPLYNRVQADVANNPALLNRLRKNPRFAGLSDDKLVDELVRREYLIDAGTEGLTSQSVSDELGFGATNMRLRESYPGGAGPIFQNVLRNKRLSDPWTWNPYQSRGRAGNPNPILDFFDRMSTKTDSMSRGGAYLNKIRKGYAPREAKRISDLTQVAYGNEAFTQFERDVATRLLPFYRFTRGTTPLVFQELTENPAGLMGQSVRLVNRLAQPSEDRHVPEHLRQSAAIPVDSMPLLGRLLGVQSPGVTRFLTDIDLPQEGLLNLYTPGVGNDWASSFMDGVKRSGSNLLGQTNPLIKGPLEYILNRQFYTGRQLSDLNSLLEPSLGSIGRPLEQFLVNMPGGSRALGLLRTYNDDRISPQEKVAKLLFNTLTGAKVQDVDQDRTVRLAARSMLNDLLDRAPGISTFENLSINPDDIGRLNPEERRQYLLYRVLQAESARKSRERRQMADDPLAAFGL